MNISVDKILDKMQLELQTAKNEGNQQKIRERLLAIRTLCDLVLDEAPAEVKPNEPVRVPAQPMQPMQPFVQPQPLPVQQSTTIQQSTKLEEDDANGDSLFDF